MSEDDAWWLSAPPPFPLELLPPSSASLPFQEVSVSLHHQTPKDQVCHLLRVRRATASKPWRGYNASRELVYLGYRHTAAAAAAEEDTEQEDM